MTTPVRQFEDPIIGDVRRARAKVLAEHDNDLGKLVASLIAKHNDRPDLVVNLRKQKADGVSAREQTPTMLSASAGPPTRPASRV